MAFFDVEITDPTRPGQPTPFFNWEPSLYVLKNWRSFMATPLLSDPSTPRSFPLPPSATTALLSTPSSVPLPWPISLILSLLSSTAFGEVGRALPEPKGTIDYLALLTQRFGRRISDMKPSIAAMGTPADRSEITFFDLETTFSTPGQSHTILEFGAILICPKKLTELNHYSTLVRPTDPSLISSFSARRNGITPDAIDSAPTFAEIADTVFDILHGRIWAGHNIEKFDCEIIKEAFAEVGQAPPEPKETIDTWALLTQRFGRRAGDMKCFGNPMLQLHLPRKDFLGWLLPKKCFHQHNIIAMATLAKYFELGQQTHRSLDDVRMNLEVLKHCATVLFLESILPDIFTVNRSLLTQRRGEEVSDSAVANPEGTGSFVMDQLSNQMENESLQPDVTMEEKTELMTPEMNLAVAVSEGSSGHDAFIEPDKVSTPNISACFDPRFHGSQRQRIKILHSDVILHLYCARLRIRFGISREFVDQHGRPRLSFVVDVPPILCEVLDACDSAAQKLSMDSGSSSEWQPVLTRKNCFYNYPTARLRIPTTVSGDVTQSDTEICQKEPSGTVKKLAFVKFDAAELDSLFKPGTFVDTFLL
ncbi:hypothetical protein Patl1_19552 [Pistacia atlantica]|uniref:Uncharacterized protein n=1 Tax=Pistacia atlantica TaxID=434234 RepID=A0ACC1C3H8_9ROSI|nr:hypothetical protein Patl1_19552 [Pistacia atlantica]